MIKKQDILERKFNKVFRGYDTVEVRYFLEMLAEEFGKLESRIKELEPIEKQLNQMNVKSPENIIKDADERARKIVYDAEKLASDVLDATKQKKESEKEEIVKLQHHKNRLIQTLNDAIRKQADLLSFLKGVTEDGSPNPDNEELDWQKK
ncbi:MAG: DivIVA domain-containing protein [Candidatus Marinimicrobia bacterium]|nr:DivIVA domain-containing protein [Candidatus Neomarinimicrobiota bacterium]MBL7068136.1 DivIVA domain-containing protein [Candidatus Neomarinimicrobiota bacterium]